MNPNPYSKFLFELFLQHAFNSRAKVWGLREDYVACCCCGPGEGGGPGGCETLFGCLGLERGGS